VLSGAAWANVVKVWIGLAVISFPESHHSIDNRNFAVDLVDDTLTRKTVGIEWIRRKAHCCFILNGAIEFHGVVECPRHYGCVKRPLVKIGTRTQMRGLFAKANRAA
jgi:hypothetical protein